MKHEDGAPEPEQLAAYVDGELDVEAHRRVEAWLAAHPDAASVVAGHGEIARLMRQTTPDLPSDACWEGLRTRIHKGLVPPGQGSPGPSNRFWRWGLGVATTAAAVLWISLAQRNPAPQAPRAATGVESELEPLVLASRGEVEIHSVAANDLEVLLVGEPPLQEALILASAGDVAVRSVQPDVDGMVPDMSGMGGQTPPMIVVPLGATPAKDPDR